MISNIEIKAARAAFESINVALALNETHQVSVSELEIIRNANELLVEISERSPKKANEFELLEQALARKPRAKHQS